MIKIEKKENKSTNLFEAAKIPLKSNKFIHFRYTYLGKKKMLKTSKKKNLINKINENISNRNGYWYEFEHKKFIEALYLCDREWLKIKLYIKDTIYVQIRSHAQKFYNKLKSFKDEELGVDFTSLHVKSLKDIVNIVKDKELISKTKRNLFYIISEKISFGKNPFKNEINSKNCKPKNVNINNNFVNTNDYNNNTNYINNKNDNLNIFENLSNENEKREELSFNSVKNDNLLFALQNSEDDFENNFNIDKKNFFWSNNTKNERNVLIIIILCNLNCIIIFIVNNFILFSGI